MSAASAVGSRRDPQPGPSSYVLAATFTVAVGQSVQAHCLVSICGCANLRRLSDPGRCGAIPVREVSGGAGVAVLVLAFALATAASVRTLALVEVCREGISRFIFKQPTTRRKQSEYR